MFGHVVRMSNGVPAKFVINHYFDPREKSFRGRPRTTLPILLDKDLEVAEARTHHIHEKLGLPKLQPIIEDLKHLEQLTENRSKLHSIVANMLVFPPPKQTIENFDSAETNSNNHHSKFCDLA